MAAWPLLIALFLTGDPQDKTGAPPLTEDWLSLGIGLLVFALALASLAGSDLLGWAVTTSIWTDPGKALGPVSKAYASLGGAGAFIACLLPVALGFLVPLSFLAHQSFKRGLLANFDKALWHDAFNSVAFASLATLTALLLGLATILAWRWRPNALRSVAMNVAQTGYTLPGLVLAIAGAPGIRGQRSGSRATAPQRRLYGRALAPELCASGAAQWHLKRSNGS